jgi:hypothetical protein
MCPNQCNQFVLFICFAEQLREKRVFLFEEQNKSLVCYPKKKYNMENIETWCKIVPLFLFYQAKPTPPPPNKPA